jgi:hypothetical protein
MWKRFLDRIFKCEVCAVCNEYTVDRDGKKRHCDCDRKRLFINGNPVNGVKPELWKYSDSK